MADRKLKTGDVAQEEVDRPSTNKSTADEKGVEDGKIVDPEPDDSYEGLLARGWSPQTARMHLGLEDPDLHYSPEGIHKRPVVGVDERDFDRDGVVVDDINDVEH